MKRFGVRKGFFGAAGSPLVEDGRVIANIGGKDGEQRRWHRRVQRRHRRRALDGDRSRGELFVAGQRGLRRTTPRRCSSRDTASWASTPRPGAVLFQRPWRSRSAASVNAATPLVVGDLIFVSATYETGAAVLRVKGNQLTELWSSDDVLSNHYATSVYANGYPVRISRAAGVQSKLSRRRSEDRHGQVERGSLSGGLGDTRRRSAAHHA